MRPRTPSIAKALLALTAAGFLLSGCVYPYYGEVHVAPQRHAYRYHDHGRNWWHGYGHGYGHRDDHDGYRRYH